MQVLCSKQDNDSQQPQETIRLAAIVRQPATLNLKSTNEHYVALFPACAAHLRTPDAPCQQVPTAFSPDGMTHSEMKTRCGAVLAAELQLQHEWD